MLKWLVRNRIITFSFERETSFKNIIVSLYFRVSGGEKNDLTLYNKIIILQYNYDKQN